MKFQIVSDLHIDMRSEDMMLRILDGIIAGGEAKGAKVLLIAGDLGEAHSPNWITALEYLASAYEQVVLIPGNHEYYGLGGENPWGLFETELPEILSEVLPNVVLGNKVKTDWGLLGTTLWFKHTRETERNKFIMNDYRYIDKDVLYGGYQESRNFLLENGANNPIWMFHHLPLRKSLQGVYNTPERLPFYVNDLTDLIREFQPKLIIHGHSHVPVDYVFENTRVVSNPGGYPNQKFAFKNSLVLDTKDFGLEF